MVHVLMGNVKQLCLTRIHSPTTRGNNVIVKCTTIWPALVVIWFHFWNEAWPREITIPFAWLISNISVFLRECLDAICLLATSQKMFWHSMIADLARSHVAMKCPLWRMSALKASTVDISDSHVSGSLCQIDFISSPCSFSSCSMLSLPANSQLYKDTPLLGMSQLPLLDMSWLPVTSNADNRTLQTEAICVTSSTSDLVLSMWWQRACFTRVSSTQDSPSTVQDLSSRS